MAKFKKLPRHFHGETEDNHKNPWSRQPFFQAVIGNLHLLNRSRNTNHLPASASDIKTKEDI
jgi:hypothetical protein